MTTPEPRPIRLDADAGHDADPRARRERDRGPDAPGVRGEPGARGASGEPGGAARDGGVPDGAGGSVRDGGGGAARDGFGGGGAGAEDAAPEGVVPPQRTVERALDSAPELPEFPATADAAAPADADAAWPIAESARPVGRAARDAAYRVADAAGAEALLRCWTRETGAPRPADAVLRLALPASGTRAWAPVHHWSPTGHHRFGPVRIAAHAPAATPYPVASAADAAPDGTAGTHTAPAPDGAPGPVAGAPGAPATAASAPVGEDAAGHAGSVGFGAVGLAGHAGGPVRALNAVELAALLAREAGGDGADAADLVARVADSVRRTAVFVAERRERPGPAEPDVPFLDSEQALLLGHPMHPAPKGREGLSDAENAAYSPETRGSFPLHWLAVDPSVLASDSAWTERGRPIQAAALLAGLAGPGLRLPEGAAPLPLHPWQARDIRHRPAVRALFEAGLLHDLGPLGDPWHATSSVRTVYRPGAPAMLKLSLGVRITNSRRENLRKELRRGTEVHRLLRSGLAAQWHAAHPGFDIVRDPAWLGVDTPEGRPVPGLDVVLRHNPFGPGDQAHCVAGLTAPRPWPGRPARELRSRLAVLVDRLAARTGRRTAAVATEWFLRYLDTVVRPVLWLDGHAGVALEAHQQNTLVLLDADGWPRGGRYRDNQGYYFRESRRADLERRLPGIGSASDTFVPDEVADERFAYYLGINNVLGLIGAFGSQELAAEEVLLAAFRRFLATADGHGSRLPGRLLGEPELRCKANLLTRLHGLDELVGPVDTQSVYVTLPNPIAAADAHAVRPGSPSAEESR